MAGGWAGEEFLVELIGLGHSMDQKSGEGAGQEKRQSQGEGMGRAEIFLAWVGSDATKLEYGGE